MTTNGNGKNHKNGNGNSNGKPKRGRKSLLTDELTEGIYDEILQGASPNNACQAFGVSRELKKQWLDKGETDFNAEQDTTHAYFYQMIFSAEGKAKTRAEKWVYAGVDGWQSNARWLEKVDPEWRRNVEITSWQDITTKGESINHGFANIPRDTIKDALAILAQAGVPITVSQN